MINITIMLKFNIIVIYVLLLFSKIAIADEHSESTTFSCKILRHMQVLRTVVTEFDKFEFEVIVKKENIVYMLWVIMLKIILIRLIKIII